MKTKPDLGSRTPTRSTRTSSPRRSPCSRQQKSLIGKYWGTAQEEIDGFANGDMAIGTAWQYQANTINAAGGKKVEVVKPKEGATGWSDTWMISSKAAHPNCMYKWMNYIISPKANADVTVYFGEAPVSAGCLRRGREAERRATATRSTRPTRRTSPTCTTGTRRQSRCLDGRGDICTDFDAWTQAWTEITGA